jgi:DNA transformation protein and related proteins
MNQDSYVAFVVEQLASLGRITTRAMFGGHAIYCDGVVFALIGDNTLYLKADDVNRPRFEAAGLGPFRPFENQDAVMQYYLAPAELFESSDGIEEWGRGAIEAGRRAAAKKKPKGARKRVDAARKRRA